MYFERDDIATFCASLGHMKTLPCYTHLVELMNRFYDRVPFTNIMMLVRGRRIPSKSEITEDILSFCGGPCGHSNPFFRDVLEYLGYRAYLVPAWMRGSMSHIALIVKLDGDDYWVDVGNGHPYFTPLSINKSDIASHCGLSYKLQSLGNNSFQILQRVNEETEFSLNYRFENTPVEFEFFDQMVYSHYTSEHFGPFRTSLRLIRYSNQEMFAIRDYEFLRYCDGSFEKSVLNSDDMIIEYVKNHFNHFKYPVKQAIRALGWSG